MDEDPGELDNVPLQIGDVVQGDDDSFRAAYHYIVYLGESLNHSLVGVILTRRGPEHYPNNVPLPEHFIRRTNQDGTDFEFQYDNTHFMAVLLDKPELWGPYSKVGEITPEGVEFINSFVSGMAPMTYAQYDQLRKLGRSRERRSKLW